MHRQLYNFCKVSSFADRMKNMQKEIIFSNNTLKGQYLEQNENGFYTGPKYKLQSKIFDYLMKKLLSAYMDNTIKGEKSIKNEDTVCILVSNGTTHEKNKISFSRKTISFYAQYKYAIVPSPCACVSRINVN